MGEEAEPLYDDDTMRIMSEAYEAADKELGVSDKVLQVTMAVAIIRALNDGERDPKSLAALAVSEVRGEGDGKAAAKPEPNPPLRPGRINLASLLS